MPRKRQDQLEHQALSIAHIDEHLAELVAMPPAQYRAEWRRLHCEQALLEGLTPSQMRRTIAWRLQDRIHGGTPSARIRQLDRLALELETDGEIDLSDALRS